MLNTRIALFLVLSTGAGAGVIACGDKDDPVAEYCGGGEGAAVTYQELLPLLGKHCIWCHATTLTGDDREGAPLGQDYDTCEAARAFGIEGNQTVQAGTMPEDYELSVAEKLQFQAWIDSGMPCGNEQPLTEEEAR